MKQEMNFEPKGLAVNCPLHGKAFSVMIETNCLNGCPYFLEHKKAKKETREPEKVNCNPPQFFGNPVFYVMDIDFKTIRGVKKE